MPVRERRGAPVRAGLGAAFLCVLPFGGPAPPGVDVALPPWGADGHRMAARAAAEALPRTMPRFFRSAREQLAWLGPEPDRWKRREFREMDQAWRYDHYIDLENVPPASRALEAPHRYDFVRTLIRDGVSRPERDVGFLPFAILELQQRLTSLWTRWHEANSRRERELIENRILDDAGILGHYVADASQPHHTTVHFDGWNSSSGASAPNPEGFTQERGFHGRFETAFVSAHVRERSVRDAVPGEPRRLGRGTDLREAVWGYIRRTHAEVEPLYRLEARHGFDPSRPPALEARAFAEARIADGAAMLRDLWWTAFVEGEAGAR